MDLMKRIACGAATLMAVALLGACALAPKLEAPQLSVTDVQVVSGDLWQQRLKVRMHVQNPNDRELPVKGITYTLEVEGQQFASGESAESFVVPALGQADFDMSVNANLAATFMKLLAHGGDAKSLDYHLSGKVALSSGWLRSIPFEQHGSFKLQ
jgi:LEA14-like dessication related protein